MHYVDIIDICYFCRYIRCNRVFAIAFSFIIRNCSIGNRAATVLFENRILTMNDRAFAWCKRIQCHICPIDFPVCSFYACDHNVSGCLKQIRYTNIILCYVTIVSNCNFVFDDVTDLILVFFLNNALVDCKTWIFRIGFIFCFTWSNDRLFRAFGCCGCLVDNAAVMDIFFCHDILCFKCFACAWCKCFNDPLITCQLICYNDIVQSYISIVGCNDLIRNGITKIISTVVSRIACCSLMDGQMRICRIRWNGLFTFLINRIFIRISSLCCRYVCNRSCQNIFFRYSISSMIFLTLTRSKTV